MGKVIRKVCAILLCATAVILAVLPAGTAEATSTHGDYEYDGATVAKYLGSDSEVTLPAWVNRVGKEAFEGYDKMTKLVLPDNVTTVDFGAFSNCSNLKNVQMSESVRTVGSSAFSGCTNLYSVSLPRTVREIGSGAFAGCQSLASVPISALNENYTSYDGVIYSSDGKKLVQYLAGRPSTTYQMPRSVREIEEYAFWGANNLAKLSIAYGVDKIPEYAFSNCKGLQHVTLPRTVQSIFAYAFEDCDSLSYINIPDSVGYIDDRAFANTKGAKLRFIDPNGNVVKTFNSEDVEQYGNGTGGAPVVKQPGYLTGDNSYDVSGNTAGVTGPSTTDAGSTTSATGTTGGTGVNATSDNGSTTYYEDGTTSGGQTFDPTNVTPLDEGDVPDTSGNTGSSDSTNISAGSGVVDAQQTSAPSNILPESGYNDGYYKASDSGTQPWDTKIEYHDFEDNMTEYDLGGGVVLGGRTVLRMSSKIPVKGFDLNNAEYEDEYGDSAAHPMRKSESDVIGDVYASYSGDSDSVTVPSGVKCVGNRAFYRNGNLRSVTLPNSVNDIGEFAFARSAISSVKLPNGVKNIDYAAFYNCPNLTDINIPGSVSHIALGAFDGTPFLDGWKSGGNGDTLIVGDGVLLSYRGGDKKVTVPEGVKHIAAGAFSKNNNIESVVIPATVEDIGEEAFSDCNNLKELVIAEGVKSIEDRAFKNSDLKVVNIPDSVQQIGLSAFDNGGKLKTVIINGDNVPSVSFNRSATRLSAKDLRTGAFEGAENAIVSRNCNLDDGTLFNPRFYGFAGEVYSIASNDDKTLQLERALNKPDANGNILINQSVDIAGQTYTLKQVKSDAFDTYRNWIGNYDYKPKNVVVNGEQSDDLIALLANVNSDILADAEAEDAYDQNVGNDTAAQPDKAQASNPLKSNITVSVNGSRFPTRGNAYANIPGNDDKLNLSITEDDSENDKINAAFLHSTGSNPSSYVPLSVDMYDKSGTVPIHKLGDSKMEVSIPVPTGMENEDGIGIATLDDNGLLETLSSEVTDDAAGKNIKFVTGHCSAFVIYSRGHEPAVTTSTDENGNPIETVDEAGAAAFLDMSGTWQSLNKKVYGPVSAKWFIIVILLALAGILFLYKPHGKKNR